MATMRFTFHPESRKVVREGGSGKWFGKVVRESGSGKWFGKVVRESGSGKGRAGARTWGLVCSRRGPPSHGYGYPRMDTDEHGLHAEVRFRRLVPVGSDN